MAAMTILVIVVAVVLVALAAWQLLTRRRRAVAGRQRRKARILRERAEHQRVEADDAEARARELDPGHR
jgi:hypothetical protein